MQNHSLLYNFRDFLFLGTYNPYQGMPSAPYGGYATLPRYGGNQHSHQGHPFWKAKNILYILWLQNSHVKFTKMRKMYMI